MKARDRILSASIELARNKGFYGVTMDELALQASVSKRTIYRHFRSKGEIIEAVMMIHMQNVAGEVREMMAREKDPEGIMHGLMMIVSRHLHFVTNPVLLDELRRHYPWLWKKIDRFRAEKLQEIIRVLRERSHKGNILKVDPRITSAAILASIQSVINPDFILDNGLSFDEVAGQLISIFRLGLLSEDG